jgi:signal transduction histidine kinase
MKKALFLLFLLLVLCQNAIYAQCKIDTLKQKLNPNEISEAQVDILNTLAQEYASCDVNKALYYANQAIYTAQKKGYIKGEAIALANRGYAQYVENPLSLNNVLNDYKTAIEKLKKIGDKDALGDVYTNYASFYQQISYTKKEYLDSAATYYKNAFAIFEQNDQNNKAAEVAGLAAQLYFEKGDLQNAEVYANKSVSLKSDTQYNTGSVIKKSLEEQGKAQRKFIYALVLGLVLMGIFAIFVIRGFLKSQKTNRLLEKQKTALEKQTEEINRQKYTLEQKGMELQEAMNTLQTKNSEMDKLNKEILLQQTQIELRNQELAEKNEELHQQQEEVKSQRDHLEVTANELEAQTEALQKSYESITILSRIGQSITSTLNFKEIFDTFYGYTTQLMPADGFRVVEYIPENQSLQYKFNTENQRKKPLIKISLKDDTNPAVWCYKNSRSILVNQKSDLQQYGLDDYSINPIFNSMLFFPLLIEESTIGAVGVYSRQEDAYNARHMEMLKTLASYATIAIQNAKTYEILNAAQEQLVESEKMAALGNLVAGVAHEINTPVGICVTAASRLDSKTQEFKKIYETGQMKRKDLADFLETSEQGTKILLSNLRRAADLVQGFKRVAVEQTSETKRAFNLKTYLQETIMALNPEFKNKPYTIDLEANDDLEINSFAGAFSQIITNLVMNSLIHGFKNKETGHILIKAFTQYKNLILVYSDNGNGMTEEVQQKVYEPFFTTNREGGGTGLGMNIVYNLAQKLGGKLSLKSAVNQGVTFTFEIPLNLEEVS